LVLGGRGHALLVHPSRGRRGSAVRQAGREAMADSDLTRDEARAMVARLMSALSRHPDVYHELLVAVRKAKVAGPWVKAKAEGIEIGNGMWRLKAQGPKEHWDIGDVAVASPSQKLEKPEVYEYALEYDETGEIVSWNEDAYDRDVEAYKATLPLWKPWTWRVGNDAKGYADTREEAMTLADEHLRSEGWILSDG